MRTRVFFNEYVRSADIGVYRLTKNLYDGKTLSYMIMMDLHRPSTLDDYPYLKHCYEEDEEFGRSNFIKVIVASDEELDKHSREGTMMVAAGFLERLEDVDWNVTFVIESKTEFSKIDQDKTELFLYAQKCANKFGLEVDLLSIPKEKFSHLTQC